ncbi:MAG: GGDEF domain-containing protein [Oscillospiraceae bacterium]|nr:GGDEF domain-containing protein [Oscillospiraceae bacterium]
MGKRKLIGIITALPESVHAKRVLKGVFAQCEKYGYNAAVFAPMINVSSQNTGYLKGELNIYELPNFDMLDAVIIDMISIIEGEVYYVADRLIERLGTEYKKTVIALNVPFENYPVAQNSDSPIFKEIVDHIADAHNARDILFLTGQKGYNIAEERADAFRKYMTEKGLDVSDDNIVYGDFWYTSGANLADDIISGKIHRPEAVICASDHMAIGLVNRLVKFGIKVPDDIIVTGFEATQESILNNLTVTSFESNASQTAADAVDMIRKQIEPDEEIIPYSVGEKGHIRRAMSCGCKADTTNLTKEFREAFYNIYPDYEREDFYVNADIGQLMEEYIGETFSASTNPQECLKNIYMKTYINKPYKNFYLCLNENWLDTECENEKGYPERMKIVVHTAQELNTGFYADNEAVEFESRIMLPQLLEETDKPSVFYFSAIHFMEKSYGYAVLQRHLDDSPTVNLVYRNWLRFVNISLEMVQAKNKLMMMSVRDEMTGAYNRRGMKMKIDEMLSRASADDMLYVFVIDMDGLKYINDTFGHNDGDLGIKTVYMAASSIMTPNEICVRAGGDEFYVFGIGKVDEQTLASDAERFTQKLQQLNKNIDKPYVVSASIGYAYSSIENLHINNVINTADERMYRNKIERKKQRI